MSRRPVAALVGLALVAACGGSEVTGTTNTSGALTTTMASVETTQAEPPTAEAPELGGTRWVVTDYSQGEGVITNVWKTEVTIAFSEDGTVSGSAGCNDYQGTWSVSGPYDEFESGTPDPNDGQELNLGSLSWTERACEDEDIMIQESEILELLQRGARWVLIRGNFNLRDAQGDFLFEAEPV